jgi:hypothetical protein
VTSNLLPHAHQHAVHTVQHANLIYAVCYTHGCCLLLLLRGLWCFYYKLCELGNSSKIGT